MNCKDCFHKEICGWTNCTPTECKHFEPEFKRLSDTLNVSKDYEYIGHYRDADLERGFDKGAVIVCFKKKSKSPEEVTIPVEVRDELVTFLWDSANRFNENRTKELINKLK